MTTQKLWTRWFFHSQLHQRQDRSSRGRRSVSKKPLLLHLKLILCCTEKGWHLWFTLPRSEENAISVHWKICPTPILHTEKSDSRINPSPYFFHQQKRNQFVLHFHPCFSFFFFVSQTQSLQRMHFNQLSYRQRSMRENQRRYHLSFYKNNIKQYMN